MADTKRKGVIEKYLGNVVALASDIDYAGDAVVSKTLLDKDAGTLTLFSFDKGQSLSTHSAPFDASVYILDGKVEITIGQDIHILTAGNFIIMPANIPHSLKAVEQFKMLLIMIR